MTNARLRDAAEDDGWLMFLRTYRSEGHAPFTQVNTRNVAQLLISGGARPGHLHGAAADVSMVAGAQTIMETFPHVDVLVNNFGIFGPKEFAELTDDDWQDMWDANVMSGVRLSRHYLPQMLQEHYGRVIFISSESALQIPADVIHYGVSKTAQLALARGMAELTVKTNVTVNSVLAGPTRSEGMGNIIKEGAEKTQSTEAEFEKLFFEAVRPTSLLKRFIRPEEIGAFVAFLCSEDASAINGAARALTAVS